MARSGSSESLDWDFSFVGDARRRSDRSAAEPGADLDGGAAGATEHGRDDGDRDGVDSTADVSWDFSFVGPPRTDAPVEHDVNGVDRAGSPEV
ncbi:MAG: hypothetical protein AAGG08_16410, partial [Actinomycetota bacterium]